MELKLRKDTTLDKDKQVLIVPFMELKLRNCPTSVRSCPRLNRTFYGIENLVGMVHDVLTIVLIVPFMELKPV